MRDSSGRIIYVGKAASLRQRVQSYFRASTMRHAPPKLRSLVHSVADLDFITVRTESDARLTENKLIKDYQPRFNVLMRDDKRFPLLSIDLNQPWPPFRLCRLKRQNSALYFGPYLSSAAARAALEFVETKFGLRKCAPFEPDAETHRHCINDIIRFCSAPCIGKITPAEYRSRVAEAIAFLRGERPLLLKELQAAMDQAAAGLNFEKAAVLRDTLQMLYAALKHKAHIARTGSRSTPSPSAGLNALWELLGLRRRPIFIQAVDISNISGKHAVGSMVAAIAGVCRPALYRRFRIKTVEAVDDATMMKEVISRHFKRLKDERKKMPDLLLVDGGIVQLRAAQSALRKLDIPELAVAGIAKKFETIFVIPQLSEGRADFMSAKAGVKPALPPTYHHVPVFSGQAGVVKTINLPPRSPALQILQRLRDEAHRFALSYHHLLRAKKIKESVLDDINGIGRTRKQILLKHFGSLSNLRQADESAIAAVPGVGPKQASKIKAFLINKTTQTWKEKNSGGQAFDTRTPKSRNTTSRW